MLSSAVGLLVGSAAAGAVGAIVLLSSGSFVYRSLPAFGAVALLIAAEGMFWALLAGGMFVLPFAVVALVAFQPRYTPALAIVLSIGLLVALFVGYFPGRTINVVFMAVPVWLGVLAALKFHSNVNPTR